MNQDNSEVGELERRYPEEDSGIWVVALLLAALVGLAVACALLGLVGYVVYHFVAKFW